MGAIISSESSSEKGGCRASGLYLSTLVRNSVFIDTARCDALCFALRRREEMLTEIVNSRTTLFSVDDVRSDVRENIAYSGENAGDEDIER